MITIFCRLFISLGPSLTLKSLGFLAEREGPRAQVANRLHVNRKDASGTSHFGTWHIAVRQRELRKVLGEKK